MAGIREYPLEEVARPSAAHTPLTARLSEVRAHPTRPRHVRHRPGASAAACRRRRAAARTDTRGGGGGGGGAAAGAPADW